MRVGVIQSNYLPWRGYFDFIASVDLFVIYDDVQYTKNDWRNRNRIRVGENKTKWISVPVRPGKLSKLINETRIDGSQNWISNHSNAFQENYRHAPHLPMAMALMSDCLSLKSDFLSQVNEYGIRRICDFFKIQTEIVRSEKFKLTGDRQTRLLNLLKTVGANVYLSGPSANAYLDKNLFAKNDMTLEYKSYDYKPYPQIHGGFESSVTVLDLIANLGSESTTYLRSQSPNVKVI